MFKNTKLFDGYAKDANRSIEKVNEMCNCLGIEANYDIRLADNLEETEESLDGWLDCIHITHNGIDIMHYLTCEGVMNWASGFCECAQEIQKSK